MNIFSGGADKTSKKVTCDQVLDLKDNPIDVVPSPGDEGSMAINSIVEINSSNCNSPLKSSLLAIEMFEESMDLAINGPKKGEFKEIDIPDSYTSIGDYFRDSDAKKSIIKSKEEKKIMPGEYPENQRVFVGGSMYSPLDEENIYRPLIRLKEKLNTEFVSPGLSVDIYNLHADLTLMPKDSLDRYKEAAEILDIYFRKLHNVFVRKDGTFYTKIVDGKTASNVIDSLIKAYPWKYLNKNKEPIPETKIEESSSKIADVSKLIEVVEKLTESVSKLLKSFE